MTETCQILIIGAGFAGLGLAIQLEKRQRSDYLILEQADEIGGVWRDNIYPGAACDVPSHLYSYSFQPNPNWSRSFSGQSEIQQYILSTAESYSLREKVRFKTEVTSARFDQRGFWQVATRFGKKYQAQFLVLAIGALNRPHIPDLSGLEQFNGQIVHTASWDPEQIWNDKNVAVIGTGASAIQLIPKLQPVVKNLQVFQRTPPWVFPKRDRAYPQWEQAIYRIFPGLQTLSRRSIFWSKEASYSLFARESRLSRLGEALAKKYIQRQISDPVLRTKVTPNYTLGCKRILLSNDYYPSLQQPNVDVITEGVTRILNQGLETSSGNHYPADILVMATGFKVPAAGAPFPITGLPGHVLAQDWAEGSESFKGVTITGYPNLLHMMGPNTGTGHTSVIFYIEAQITYMLQYIDYLESHHLSYLNLMPQAQADFNQQLQAKMAKTVWKSGCASWYLAPNGKNTTLWPGFSWDYFLKTRWFDAQHYQGVMHSSLMPPYTQKEKAYVSV